jgi:hypothetical protein
LEPTATDETMPSMTGRNATRLARSLGGLILAILLVAATFLILDLDTPPPEESFGIRGWGLILSAAFAVAGVLIASRVPSNPIGMAPPRRGGRGGGAGAQPAVLDLRRVRLSRRRTGGRVRGVDHRMDLDPVHGGGGDDHPAALPRRTSADRLAALGGELDVRSAPDDGTTVAGMVPARMIEAG